LSKNRNFLTNIGGILKLEGEVTSLSENSQGEVGDNREKWGDFWETGKNIWGGRNSVNNLGVLPPEF
jgi:hypothetical protein